MSIDHIDARNSSVLSEGNDIEGYVADIACWSCSAAPSGKEPMPT